MPEYPKGLSLRTTLRGHEGTILRAAWMPNSDVVATASIDNTVRFWDIDNGTEFHRLVTQAKGFTGLIFNPDGRYAATTTWDDPTIQIWHIETSSVVMVLRGHSLAVNGINMSPDGASIVSASDDDMLKVWSLESGTDIQTLRGHTNYVWTALFTPDARFIISGSADASIKVWDVQSGSEMLAFGGHSEWVTSLALAPDGRTLASASDDRTIRIWDLYSGRVTNVLGGHLNSVSCVDFSADGRLLGSKSQDHTVRLWRTDTWEQVAVLDEPVFHGLGYYPNALSFHPTKDILATLGEKNMTARIWDIDYDLLCGGMPRTQTYAVGKIVLLGDQLVGKSSLAHQIAHERSSQHHQTERFETWVIDDLSITQPDGLVGKVALWDFRQQANQNIIHSLFLDDVDVALLLFDVTSLHEPLKKVEAWLRYFHDSPERPPQVVLVGTRLDYGTPTIGEQELRDFCRHHNITGGYVLTSARTDQGIDQLVEMIRGQIDWEMISSRADANLFLEVQNIIQRLQSAEGKRIRLLPRELRTSLQQLHPDWEFTDGEMMMAVRQLEKHGFVTVLTGQQDEEHILLYPDLLVKVCAAILAAAQNSPRRLGTLDEIKLRRGEYSFAILANLEHFDQQLLMHAALHLLEKQKVFFREAFEVRRLLIFPALMSQRRPLMESPDLEDDASYHVKGDVKHIYAALVVLLNYTSLYTRTYQWGRQAQFQMGLGEICGFRVIEHGEDELELVLYYGRGTQGYTRLIFHGLFERFLDAREIDVTKYPSFVCPRCRQRQERGAIIRMMKQQREAMFCMACGTRINLLQPSEAPLVDSANGTEPAPPIRTGMSAHFRNALNKIKEYFLRDQRKPAACFISYAWGVPSHEYWVSRLAGHLREAGIDVTVDHWDKPNIGQSVEPFLKKIEEAEYILMVGTPDYRQKFDQKLSSMGSVVAKEIELISRRLSGTEQEKSTVLPLLLEGDVRDSFPTQLHDRVTSDFQQERFYFVSLFNLILTLYRVPSQDPSIGDLRVFMREGGD